MNTNKLEENELIETPEVTDILGTTEPEAAEASTASEAETETKNAEVEPAKIGYTKEEIERLKQQENFPMGICAGIITAIVMAVLWGIITVATRYQIGYMAIAVGFAVGFAIRKFGKGVSLKFGLIGAAFSLLGCLLGNYFSIIGFASMEYNVGFFQTISSIKSSLIPELMVETFDPMDVLFYGIALYSGYNYSFTKINE